MKFLQFFKYLFSMRYLSLLLVLITFLSCQKNIKNPYQKETELGLVPKVQFVELKQGGFEFNQQTVFVIGENADPRISKAVLDFGLENPLKTSHVSENNSVNFMTLEIDSLPKSAYSLEIGTHQVDIKSKSSEGYFYALQTLRQLLPDTLKKGENYILPALKIVDYPKFEWRGAHLDVGRHFYPKSFIKKYIDLLAKHKMNRFHWHLTEDQGWRIEIKQYPLLSEISSKRKETIVKKNFDPYVGDGKEHRGFYTQEDVKEIVAYANDRFVTIVPEIEMPGHSLAVLAAYPELSCTGKKFEVGTRWGVYDDVYCAGNEAVFEFLENVLDEVVALFPSKYIHIGGDECPKTRWETCAKCQKRIKAEGLKNEHELQSYFIRRMEAYLLTKGKNIIGWDEILEGGLAPQATVMSWRGEKGGIEAANDNHKVVMSPNKPCYLDHYQSEDTEKEPLAIGGFNSLEAVFNYHPIPEELPKDKHQYILGAQGNVWTEYMPTGNHVEYMAYPRLCALSEVVWTADENRNYKQFEERMNRHYQRLDSWKVNYRPKDM